MMYRLTPSLNDGKRDAPPLELDVVGIGQLVNAIASELSNDYGEPFGVGFTLLVERIA